MNDFETRIAALAAEYPEEIQRYVLTFPIEKLTMSADEFYLIARPKDRKAGQSWLEVCNQSCRYCGKPGSNSAGHLLSGCDAFRKVQK